MSRFANVFLKPDEVELLRRHLDLSDSLTSHKDDHRLEGTPWRWRLLVWDDDEGEQVTVDALAGVLLACLLNGNEHDAAKAKSVLDRAEARFAEQLLEAGGVA